MDQQKLYPGGKEEAKKSYAILENIFIIILIVTGFLGMYPLSIDGFSFLSIFYVLFVAVMLMFVLRKHLCTGCYYYGKWCHCGWGKLSSAMFKKDSGNQELGGTLAGLTWGIIMGLPIIGMLAVIISGKTPLIDELLFLIPFIILVVINAILHKKDCETCKMQCICPLSAVKKK